MGSMRQPSGKAPVSSIKSEKPLDEKEIVVTRPRLRKRRTLETKTFSEEIPVAGVKTDEPEALTADQPVAPPVGSEPEMTKAMMTFYGITTEDIEQFVSSVRLFLNRGRVTTISFSSNGFSDLIDDTGAFPEFRRNSSGSHRSMS